MYPLMQPTHRFLESCSVLFTLVVEREVERLELGDYVTSRPFDSNMGPRRRSRVFHKAFEAVTR